MNDVVIKIVGKITTDGDTETVEMTTLGTMTEKNGKWYINYEENPENDRLKTLMKVDGCNSVVLQRMGAYSSRIAIQRGQRQLCHYGTQYGDMMIGVFGEEIRNTLTRSGGEVYMRYTIDINADLRTQNEVSVSIKEANPNVPHS